MKCPRCTSTDLLMSSRESIEIDYCPTCRGVWLDRGELDIIIQRTNAMLNQYHHKYKKDDYDNDYDHHHDDDHNHYGRKKHSFFDIFDF